MPADTVRDLKLGLTGDIVLAAGDLVLVRGTDAVVQSVRSRLLLFKGEWFLDLDAGMPWYQEILIKNPDVSRLQSLFRDRIAGTKGVSAVNSLTLLFDRANRRLTVTYTAAADAGLIGDTVVI